MIAVSLRRYAPAVSLGYINFKRKMKMMVVALLTLGIMDMVACPKAKR
jgi:hypothetical protein